MSRRVLSGRMAIALMLAVSARLAAQVVQPRLPLTPVQMERLERREPVQVLEAVATPWPRSIVYQLIAATPEESAAVLADFELQASYIPRMKSSRILRQVGGAVDVEYVIGIPVFPDERSVSRQRVVVDGDTYKVIWQTVTDSQPRGSVTTGSATFMPMVNRRTGRGATLMIHDQLVIPASAFARVGMVRNKAIEASRESAAAIRRQVEHEVAADRALLQRQIVSLRALR